MPGSARAHSSRSPWRPRCAGCTASRSTWRRTRWLLDRGARSGLGTGFFREGGLALDGGRGRRGSARADHRAAAVSGGLAHPADPRSRRGRACTGPEEIAAFQALPAFPAELAAHLCRLALMQALPAVVERDLARFGRAVTRNPDARRRLFRRRAGRALCEPRCRRRPRSASPKRRRRLWAELLGTDRLRACRFARGGAPAGRTSLLAARRGRASISGS